MVVQLTITAWLALEAGLLIRDRVRGKGSIARDQGTLWLNIMIITAAVVAAGILTGGLKNAAAWQFGSTRLIVAGLLVMWTGLVVRIWAIVVLGKSFRTTVEVDTGQKVVDSGPYRWVRHPSYTGILLLVAGLSLVYCQPRSSMTRWDRPGKLGEVGFCQRGIPLAVPGDYGWWHQGVVFREGARGLGPWPAPFR